MATYQHKTSGETAVTVNGSRHDQRLAESDDWKLVDDGGTTEEPEGPPPKSATKDEWAAYARSQGMPSYEVDQATKADLIERFTGQEG